MQYNTIKYNAIVLYCIVLYRSNTIQYNTIQYNVIVLYCIVLQQYNTILLHCIVLYCIVLQQYNTIRDFCLPHLHSTPLLRGSRRNIATTSGMEKLEWCCYQTVKKFWRHVYPFWQNLRMWQTDGWTDIYLVTASIKDSTSSKLCCKLSTRTVWTFF